MLVAIATFKLMAIMAAALLVSWVAADELDLSYHNGHILINRASTIW